MMTGHDAVTKIGLALEMTTGHALARISLSRQHDLALPHQPAAARIAAVQVTAVIALGRTAAGKIRKSCTRIDHNGLTNPATIEACRTAGAMREDGRRMRYRTMRSMPVRRCAVAGRKRSGRIMAVTSVTGAHGMTAQPGSMTRRKVPGYRHGNVINRLRRTGRTLTDPLGEHGRAVTRKSGADLAAGVLPPRPETWHRQATSGQ
jgi:hypothetical protein